MSSMFYPLYREMLAPASPLDAVVFKMELERVVRDAKADFDVFIRFSRCQL